ncbi:hypothetical protein V8E36_004216 [Tilletia maclaganii]
MFAKTPTLTPWSKAFARFCHAARSYEIELKLLIMVASNQHQAWPPSFEAPLCAPVSRPSRRLDVAAGGDCCLPDDVRAAHAADAFLRSQDRSQQDLAVSGCPFPCTGGRALTKFACLPLHTTPCGLCCPRAGPRRSLPCPSHAPVRTPVDCAEVRLQNALLSCPSLADTNFSLPPITAEPCCFPDAVLAFGTDAFSFAHVSSTTFSAASPSCSWTFAAPVVPAAFFAWVSVHAP